MSTAATITGFDPNTALLTVGEVTTEMGGSREAKYAAGDLLQVTQGAIMAATAEIEELLDRTLFVHPLTLYPEWRASRRPGSTYEAWAEQWPYLPTTAGVTAGAIKAGGQRLYSSDAPLTVERFAGFRRADQSLADLKAIDGLEQLATLPPALPSLIREVMVQLALITITRREDGQYDYTRKSQSVGQSMVTVESGERAARTRELARLSAYRRLW